MKRLSVAQIAAATGRHPDTIRRALDSGELHGMQRVRGGRWLVRPECVDPWLDGQPCEHKPRLRSAS